MDGQDDFIFGLLRMGVSLSARTVHGKLNTGSVLETAPHLRYHIRERRYQGVGKVLVARLIAESILRGYGGALIVSPRPQAIPFYLHLGFQPFSRDARRFYNRKETGSQLLQSVLLRSEDK